MLSNHLDRFLRDERGGYTIWGLLWFMLYVGIGGLAVDVTDAYRNQTMLQATADAAALAGIMSPLDDEDEVDTWAVANAEFNMASSVHGEVLKTTEVDIGTWNFTDREFSVGGANPNAVRAITRRDATNENPVATNFLRIIGLQTWNVTAEGIAAYGVDECGNNGILSCGKLDFKTHTSFVNNICLIGKGGFQYRRNGTTFETGVYVGAGCGPGDHPACVGPGNQVWGNEDFDTAFNVDGDGNYGDLSGCPNAMNTRDYIEAVRNMHTFPNFKAFNSSSPPLVDYSGYNYLSEFYAVDGETGEILSGDVPGYQLVTELPVDEEGNFALTEDTDYTIYDLDCLDSGYDMPSGTYDHVAVIADCPLTFTTGTDYTITNSLIATTYSGKRPSINAQGHIDIGDPGTCGGGSEFYSLGDVHFAAAGDFANVRFLVDGNMTFAASADAAIGMDVETTGDFFVASGAAAGSTFGLCDDAPPNGGQSLSIALVH